MGVSRSASVFLCEEDREELVRLEISQASDSIVTSFLLGIAPPFAVLPPGFPLGLPLSRFRTCLAAVLSTMSTRDEVRPRTIFVFATLCAVTQFKEL